MTIRIMVDFWDSDQEYHFLCPGCFGELPRWVFRCVGEPHEHDENHAPECEGCTRKEMGWG